MQTQAPYEYIRDYYRQVHDKIRRNPKVAGFWLDGLRHVKGAAVLNAGCGPMLYDNVRYFGEPPREYVGLDINQSTFEFLENDRDPRLLQGKAAAQAQCDRIELLRADILECADALAGRFDCVLGVGFFATFHGERFEKVMRIAHRSIRGEGRLVKITWHGPRRTAAETRDKLKYRYDNAEEQTPDELVAAIERAGFALLENSVLHLDPERDRWDAIQVALFAKTTGA